MAGCFDHMWWGRLYHHMQGAAAGEMGQCIGTLDNGLAGVEVAATVYANGIFFTQIDLAKSTCSLAPAPVSREEMGKGIGHMAWCFSQSMGQIRYEWPYVPGLLVPALAVQQGGHRLYICVIS